MSSSQDQRPRFFQGQYLGAEDLTAAVEYSRIQQARHLLGAHTWGIAMGLQLKESPLPGGRVDMHILPGYAWDGFGRPILLLAPFKVPTELFKPYVFDSAIDNGTPEGRLIEVWLRYDEARTQNVRPGFESCDGEDERSRVQETFRIEIGERKNHIDQHDRISVAGNLMDAQEVLLRFDPQTPHALVDESVPFQDLPEENHNARWLILLGYVRWKPNANPNQPGSFVKRGEQDLKASRAVRRYIGVVAESVQAADGVIRIRDRTKDYSKVASADLLWVEGDLRTEGDLHLFEGKLDFRDEKGLDNAIPLSIQRKDHSGVGGSLQVVIGKDTKGTNKFSVGPLEANPPPNTPPQVQPKLTVRDDGKVGIGTDRPKLTLDIQGDGEFGRDERAVLHLFGSRIGDVGGAKLFIRAFTGGFVVFDDPSNKVGVGLNAPLCKLHVTDSTNAAAINVNAHVAVIENTDTGTDADVLALKVGNGTPGAGNNFITFFGGNNAVGRIEGGAGGVAFISGGADFAECLPRLHCDEVIEEGDVVGIFEGRISKVTEAAHHVTAITGRPIVAGNSPAKENEHLYGTVAFLGQVRVKVRGGVRTGDFIIPCGLNDGVGIAISPDRISNTEHAQHAQIVGRAWESSDEEEVKTVNVAVGLVSNSPNAQTLSLLHRQQNEIEALRAELKNLMELMNCHDVAKDKP